MTNSTQTGSIKSASPSPTAFDLSSYLKEKRHILDGYLEKILQQLNPGHPLELLQAMGHSLMAGGKRLRPVLAMASAEACGGDPRLALPAACAIEMIHTYSLIHDDLPAMDNDELRRGVPTCHKAFTEATAILAGDALLTHAFTLLTDARALALFKPCPDKAVLFDLVARISHAAGPYGMVEGQMMDMQAEGRLGDASEIIFPNAPSQDMEMSRLGEVNGVEMTGNEERRALYTQPQPQDLYSGHVRPPDTTKHERTRTADRELFHIKDQDQDQGKRFGERLVHLETLHRLKTGRMIMVSVESGALSVEATKAQINHLVKYAENIGLAFQVADDILNVEGDPAIMGKAAGSDALSDKMTYPALMGLDASKKFARQLINDAKAALAPFGDNALPLMAIANYILDRKR